MSVELPFLVFLELADAALHLYNISQTYLKYLYSHRADTTAKLSITKANNFINVKVELCLLFFVYQLMMLYMCSKFCKNTCCFNGSKVTERTRI